MMIDKKEKSIQEQLEALKRELLDRMTSPVVGTYEGKPVKQCDIAFDPKSNTYKVKTDHGIVDVDPKHILSDGNNDGWGVKLGARQKNGAAQAAADEAYRKTYLGDWGPGASSDSQSFDPLRARIEARGYSLDGRFRPVDTGAWGVRITDKAIEKLSGAQPWDDPLLGQRQKAENTIAVMGDPDPTHMDAPIPVYFHDRWAGKPWNVLADEAVELLRDKKGVDIRVADKQVGSDGVLLSYVVHRNYMRVEVKLLLKPNIFDRLHKTDLDDYAKLMKKFDTHTYIILRIAYVLGQAYRISDRDAGKIDLPIVKILWHVTKKDF